MDRSPHGHTATHQEGCGVRERILAVAGALFAEKGYSTTSVREIADGVGVTVPALYYHFGSKRGMLLELVASHCETVTGTVVQALERNVDPGHAGDTVRSVRPGAAAALVAGLQAYVATLSSLAGTSPLALRDPSLYVDPEIRALISAAERTLVAHLAKVLREGTASGELCALDAEKTASLLLAAARGVHMSPGLWDGTGDAAALGRSLGELMLDGLRP